MVSRAKKQIWKSVALGLGLCPVFGGAGVAPAQSMNPAPAAPAVGTASGTSPAALGNDQEACRQLVREGRVALKAGDKVKAEKLARQAAALRVSLPFWETDTPEKLLLDIGVKTTPPPAGMAKKPVDPHLLVKQGQDALKAGKIDDAQKMAQQAKLATNAKWGMFEETPDKLLDEVQKARAARDKEQSVKTLAEGRKQFEQGKYDAAKKLAYSAIKLHGPYGVWDFGDKPEKLLADIQTAEDKARKTKLPPAPVTTGTAVATNKPVAKPTSAQAPAANFGVMQASAAPAPNWPKEVKTADVKGPDFGPGVITAAVVPGPALPIAVMPASGPMMPEPMPTPVAPMPSMPMPVAAMPTAPMPPVPMPAVPMPAPVPAPVAFNPAKMQAMQCMVEGKAHQAAGRYMDARSKYLEARACRAEFGPADESPEQCLMGLSSTVAKQIDAALKEAGPSAESKLHQARLLAVGFALDTRPIDAQLAGMKGTMTSAARNAPTDATSVGKSILEKATLELRRGQCETARQLAAEVHNGPYGLQAEAVAILQKIDVEEHNQRVLAANRTFDAGVAAYRGKDFNQALAIFQQVEPSLLAPEKKEQLRNVMQNCSQQMSVAQVPPPPPPGAAVMPVSAPGNTAGGVTTAAAKSGVTGLQGPMPKMTAPADGDSLAAQVQAMQDIEYQRLRQDGLEVQTKAVQQWERGETDAALESLDGYLKKVKASKLDPASVARLQKPIDARLNSFRLLKADKDANTSIASSKDKFLKQKSLEITKEQKKQEQVKDLMKEYNRFYKEAKYDEAHVAAAKAHELDPDDSTITAAMQMADNHRNQALSTKNRKDREELFVTALGATENEGPAVEMDHPIAFNPVTMKYANKRKDQNGVSLMRTESAKEREIQSRLNKPIQVNFRNVPLVQAIDDIRHMTNLNIYLATEALSAEAISSETPVTLEANGISLKAALQVLLDQAHLTYVTRDEMLKITTHRGAQGNTERKVYSVADLITPIPDFVTPNTLNIHQAMDRIVNQQGAQLNGGGGSPMTNQRNMLQNGQPVGTGTGGNPSMSTMPNGQNSMSTGTIQPGSTGSTMSYVGTVAPTKQTYQDMLIKLITNTVAPTSWAEVGGSGSIDYMPIGMALVVTQTADVQEQVADLLEALRKLQDLEVAVEVRIITLAETFFERIGLDLALNIKTDKINSQYEPQLTTGQFAPAGQINFFNPKSVVSGITGIGNQPGPGNFTSDLNIPIRSSSFQYAIPPFAYPNNPGFDGGLSLGLAFLSDIQVYMFMEAAQGDRRTNVMSAPKLTLFNGQTSTINVNDQQFFVTNVNVVGFGGQIVFVPINNPVPLGVALTIQAVISADRRFVRLNLAPTLTNLASATVPLFPVTTFITPVFEGGAQGQPIPFTQFIQQPNVATVSIQTTVSIPDGGTVILGGLKTLSEGRNEFGPPVLSKLPYIDRLFKNVGYGREAQSLLLMVTPRIIINSEEEERQTGEKERLPQVQP